MAEGGEKSSGLLSLAPSLALTSSMTQRYEFDQRTKEMIVLQADLDAGSHFKPAPRLETWTTSTTEER